MNEHRPWKFTCNTCGGHKLNIYRIWTILAGPESESWQEWGPLEANHLWRFEYKEKIEIDKDKEDDVNRWNFGEYTKDNSSSKPADYEIYEPHKNPGNDKFYVNCAGCDREIEFGWSQPNRGGGIFPVECSDFNPEEIWPEPRYLDSWQKKGWLKKEDDMSENKDVVQVHGCIVCGRLLNVLAVYAPDGELIGCTVTNPGGHCVPDENQLLAACDTHTAEDIESAYKRWLSRNDKELEDEQEDE